MVPWARGQKFCCAYIEVRVCCFSESAILFLLAIARVSDSVVLFFSAVANASSRKTSISSSHPKRSYLNAAKIKFGLHGH